MKVILQNNYSCLLPFASRNTFTAHTLSVASLCVLNVSSDLESNQVTASCIQIQPLTYAAAFQEAVTHRSEARSKL